MLPPKNIEKTNGKIAVVHGNLSISDSGWGVNGHNFGVGPFNLASLNDTSNGQINFFQNECISVLYQAKDDFGEELKVFKILPQ